MNIGKSLTPTKKYKKILSAVHMVYRLVNSTYNVQELALRLTRLICQFIDADYASLHVLNTEKNSVDFVAIFNNQINILLDKKKDLRQISDQQRRVSQGYVVFKSDFIGLPLVADDNVGAVFVRRKRHHPAFTEADKELLSVVAEQAVTAIRNIQLNEEHQKVILSSVKFIGELLRRHGHDTAAKHIPVYFKLIEALARKMNVGQEGIDVLYYASVLRDSGAVDVPYDLLSKRSQLSAEEFKVIRQQPEKSAELIRPVAFLKPVLPIILYRHEKFDGSGYPSGLWGEQIPLGARIMAVVDAFEAMTQERPYKQRLSPERAVEELEFNRGTQFDPKVVNAFVSLLKQKKFSNYIV